MTIITFQEALEKASSGKKHLLLGNGFSIAWNTQIFSYTNLLEQADENNAFEGVSPAVRELFSRVDTSDFETIVRMLNGSTEVLSLYPDTDEGFIELIRQDAENLKNILAETVARNHPDFPSAVTEEESVSCKQFLINFDTIFTLNYDLLLYWTIIHFIDELDFKDGFEDPYDELLDGEYFEEDYVKWSLGNETKAELMFLHGALHLYDAGSETRKFTWSRTGITLKEQVLEALNNGMFPLFVAEGTAEEKFTKINHNSYLSRCFRSFQSSTGNLFIHGLSLKENDSHITKAIVEGKYTQIFISLHGEEDSEENANIKVRVERLVAQRQSRNEKKLEINSRSRPPQIAAYFYQAESASVWG